MDKDHSLSVCPITFNRYASAPLSGPCIVEGSAVHKGPSHSLAGLS